MYYMINSATGRVIGTASGSIEPIAGVTVYQADTAVDNYYDYILKDGKLTYQPVKESEA